MHLPTDLSGNDLEKGSRKSWFVFQRQKGSHMILRRESPKSRVVVPAHQRLRPGTLRQILHEAGLTVEQLKKLL